MLSYFGLKLLLFVIFSASAFLPCPQNVRMTAVDLNFVLHWDWNDTFLKNVSFTADYTYSDAYDDENSYIRVCNGSHNCQCDFTTSELSFLASFAVRVRAETRFQFSNWKQITFTPDKDVLLTPPSRVDVKTDVDVLTVIISESVMSKVMTVQYRLLYWEQLKPEEKHIKVCDSTYATLSSLKPWTVYCIQASVFSQKHDKSSNYTLPQCVFTTGHNFLWHKILIFCAVLCSVLIFGVLLYAFFCKFKMQFSSYSIPDSFLALPSDIPSLLEAQEESCTVAFTGMNIIPVNQQKLEHIEYLDNPKSVCHSSSSSKQDSGISSGEETIISLDSS